MSPRQIALVRQSWRWISGRWDAAGMVFYSALFDADPSLRLLFRGEPRQQAQRLMNMIDIAVNGLDYPAELVPAAIELGIRHRAYGVAPPDYETVGKALLSMLQAVLGARCNEEVLDAWAAVYGFLVLAMQQRPVPGE